MKSYSRNPPPTPILLESYWNAFLFREVGRQYASYWNAFLFREVGRQYASYWNTFLFRGMGRQYASYWNRFFFRGWAGSTHPTGMLSCLGGGQAVRILLKSFLV